MTQTDAIPSTSNTQAGTNDKPRKLFLTAILPEYEEELDYEAEDAHEPTGELGKR